MTRNHSAPSAKEGAEERRDHPLVAAAVRAKPGKDEQTQTRVGPKAAQVEPVTQTRAPEPPKSAVEIERHRAAEIARIFSGLDAARGQELITSGASLEEARAAALQLHETAPGNFAGHAVDNTADRTEQIYGDMARGALGFKELARICLSQRNQSIPSNGTELFKRAQSTSDFSALVSGYAVTV